MKIGVIGGGTMGLTMAYRLVRQGHQVTVLEAAPQLGGLATWFDYGDFIWDKYYHVICRQDEHLLGLIEELGVADRMCWSETRTGFLWRGRHLSMSNHWEFLRFPALSALDKARLALGILRIQRMHDAEPLERIPASRWLTGIFGQRVYEAIWEPLLESKYGVLKDQMPATIMWATIRRYYSTRSKGGGQECMGYLAGGLKTFYDALAAAILREGGSIHCSMPVFSIEETGPDRAVAMASDRQFEFDRVVSTVPTTLLTRLAPRVQGLVGAEEARPLFLGVICLALVMRRPLSPYYITNLIQKGFPFTGIIELSNLTGATEFNDCHLALLPRYDTPDSPWFEYEPEQIQREFMAGLGGVWPDIEENVVRTFVNRERMVQALWLEQPPRLDGPRKSERGAIWSVNAELTGRDTLNNNAIVKVANEAARELGRSLQELERSRLAFT